MPTRGHISRLSAYEMLRRRRFDSCHGTKELAASGVRVAEAGTSLAEPAKSDLAS
jgi:hypothetical protein